MSTPKPFVALLRGVNVGGKAKVPMAALRAALTEDGFEDVATYIQSGNVVFRAPGDRKALARRIEQRITTDFGVSPKVILRTPAELARIVERNPFGRDASHVHVLFLGSRPTAKAIRTLDPERSPGDELAVDGSQIYLYFPNGSGRTKLTLDYFERKLGVEGTARNWRTLLKLLELS
jgi:uncharacterized protein (DUF1697 family)